MTCPPIPPAAMPVVERIRAEVPRPKELPVTVWGSLRWVNEKRDDEFAAWNFMTWFDNLRADQAAAAMDLIWPPREEGT